MHVKTAELKARLSEYLQRVRRGQIITVLDRSTPVARLVPYESDASGLSVRGRAPGAPRLRAVALPPPLPLRVDIVSVLMAERQVDR